MSRFEILFDPEGKARRRIQLAIVMLSGIIVVGTSGYAFDTTPAADDRIFADDTLVVISSRERTPPLRDLSNPRKGRW